MLSGGKTALRGIAKAQNAAYKIYEMGIEEPACDMQTQASLSEIDCARSIAFGMEVVSEGADLIVIGNAGIGTATAAAEFRVAFTAGRRNIGQEGKRGGCKAD